MDDSNAELAMTEDGAMACRRCGTCCTRHQAIVSPAEARHIAGYLKITPAAFVSSYTDRRWHSGKNYLLRHADGACVFLQYRRAASYCLVHPVKPACCLEWAPHPARRECREGLTKSVSTK